MIIGGMEQIKENNMKINPRGMALVFLLGSLTALDPLSIDMYLPAFGQIQTDFATSINKVELSVSTFFIGMAFGQLIYGPLADRFGRKKPLLAGMLVYLMATIACAIAPTIEWFIGFRLLQALGGCAGMVITRAIIRDLFDKRESAIFLSQMALIMGVAPIIAPSIGSFISVHFGWKAIFWTLALANIICLFTISTFLPETNTHQKSEIKILSTIKSYAGLLKNPEFVGYLLPDTLVRAGMFAYIAGSPFVFINLLGISESRYGLIFGMNGLGLMAAAQINRRLLAKFTPNQILKWGVNSACLAGMVIFIAAWMNLGAVVMLCSLFIFLMSLNFISPNALVGALSSQGHQAGTASALYGCLQWVLASVAAFFVSHFHNGTALPMTGTILFCGLLSFTAFKVLVKKRDQAALS